MLYNIYYWWFCLSQGNWWRKYLAHPKIWRWKPCLLMFVFGRLSPAAVHSGDCRFNSWAKWWIHLFIHCHIFTQKLLFIALKQLQTMCCFWSTWSKHSTHFEHSFLFDKCSCKKVNKLPSDIFNSSTFSRNFNLRLAKTSLWSFLVFSGTIAKFGRSERSASLVCMSLFKVSIPRLNRCSWWSRVRITLIKPLLCLNNIFSLQKAMLYQYTKFRFFHCFENK